MLHLAVVFVYLLSEFRHCFLVPHFCCAIPLSFFQYSRFTCLSLPFCSCLPAILDWLLVKNPHSLHLFNFSFQNFFYKQADGSKLSRERSSLRAGNLTVKLLKKEDHGRYECVVANEIATIVAETLLIVNSKSFAKTKCPTNLKLPLIFLQTLHRTRPPTSQWMPATFPPQSTGRRRTTAATSSHFTSTTEFRRAPARTRFWHWPQPPPLPHLRGRASGSRFAFRRRRVPPLLRCTICRQARSMSFRYETNNNWFLFLINRSPTLIL